MTTDAIHTTPRTGLYAPAVPAGANASSTRGLRHLPGLDGVRGLGVALVLFSHSVIYGRAPSLSATGLRSGAAGVTLFFVLSGYLITTLLVREETAMRRISLPLFYTRRALRLFPALWLYLTVITLLWLAGRLPHHPWHSLVTSVLYIRNLVGRGHETDHLWSIALEEQFYLIWPVVVVALSWRRRLRLPVVLGIFLVVTAWRHHAALAGLASAGALYIRTDFAIDGPLLGCALALAEARWPDLTRVWRSGRRPAVVAGLALVGLAAWIGFGSNDLVRPALQSTLVAGLGIPLVWSQAGSPGRGVGLIAWRPLVYLGQISYGVYLWQQLFLGPPTVGFELVRSLPLGWLATLAVAASSYALLEAPLLRLKDRCRPQFARGDSMMSAIPPEARAQRLDSGCGCNPLPDAVNRDVSDRVGADLEPEVVK